MVRTIAEGDGLGVAAAATQLRKLLALRHPHEDGEQWGQARTTEFAERPQAGGKWSTGVPFAMGSLPPAQGPGYGAGVHESGGEPDSEVGARGPAAEQVVRIETGRVVRARAQALVVTVAGEIDGFTVDRLRAAVAAGFDQLGDAEILVIDLTEVTFLGSQGLQALFDVTQAARRRREPLRIVVDHNRPVIRPMQLTGLDDVLALFDTVDAALDFTS